MNKEFCIRFKNSVKNLEKKYNIKLNSICPFDSEEKTVAIIGKQHTLAELFLECKNFIEDNNPELCYVQTISNFHIDDSPFEMIYIFRINGRI